MLAAGRARRNRRRFALERSGAPLGNGSIKTSEPTFRLAAGALMLRTKRFGAE